MKTIAKKPIPTQRLKVVTIKTIGDHLGLSHSTVSLALRGSKIIKTTTRDLVERTAKELGYTRSRLAQSMKTGRTRVLGLVAQMSASEACAIAIRESVAAAEARDYLIKLIPVPYDFNPSSAADLCFSHSVDGVLTFRLNTLPLGVFYENVRCHEIPLAAINEGENAGDISVDSDDATGTKLLIQGLYDLGHRKIAYVGSSVLKTRDRTKDVVNALSSVSLPLSDSYLCDGRQDVEHIEHGVRHLLALSDRPTALVCYNDRTAAVALRVAMEAGLNVPKDLSITGFCNTQVAKYAVKAITSVDQNFGLMAKRATEHLIDHLERGELESPKPKNDLIACQVIWRASTGPAPKGRA